MCIRDRIKYICPLHGPVWRKDLGWFIEKYDTWSRYAPETQGVLIVCASMYGNTENAAQALAASLCDTGMSKVAMYDVSSTHVSQLIDVYKRQVPDLSGRCWCSVPAGGH